MHANLSAQEMRDGLKFIEGEGNVNTDSDPLIDSMLENKSVNGSEFSDTRR